jgi:hypothetical protein
MPKSRTFVMPPSFTPEVPIEQKAEVDVYAVLRDHMKYVELIHNELRHSRRSQQELDMKVSELSSKVDTLIGIATDLKGRVDAGASNVPAAGSPATSPLPPQDDPEVEALAHRIDDAIAVLTGAAHVEPAPTPPSDASGTVPPANVFDPNSPVPVQPSPEALATDINSPQARDPNAPV